MAKIKSRKRLQIRTDSNKGLYPREVSHYKVSHCQECPLKSKYTRSKEGRSLQGCHDLERMKATVRANMSTNEGHDTMVSRSIQAEGTFGDLKNNFGFERFHRRRLENVKFELYLIALGHNIRKLTNRMDREIIELDKYGRKT